MGTYRKLLTNISHFCTLFLPAIILNNYVVFRMSLFATP